MRVALIKLGCRFAFNSKSKTGGVQEAISIIDMLNTAGVEVDVYDKILKGDSPSPTKMTRVLSIDKVDVGLFDEELPYYETVNDQGYDALIVLNGNVTYFGGEDRPHETKKLIILNEFKGKVFYIIGDFNLFLKDNYKNISLKKWAVNYEGHNLRTDREDIVYISQGKNVDLQKQDINRLSNVVNVRDVVYFPIEKFPWFVLDQAPYNEEPEFDIIYGGNFRGGKREGDMIKFLFGYPDNIKVRLFGEISESKFDKKKIEGLSKPEFYSKSFDYLTYCNELHRSKSIVIIGDGKDKLYNKTAARVFEAVRMGLVLFIDETLDPNKTIFSSELLRSFCYVNSREDIIERLGKMNYDDNIRKIIVGLEIKDLDTSYQDYCNDFRKILEEY